MFLKRGKTRGKDGGKLKERDIAQERDRERHRDRDTEIKRDKCDLRRTALGLFHHLVDKK